MKMGTFGKKVLSVFLAMALMLGMVATIPMSAFAADAETKVLADELEGYNRITATEFESSSNQRQGKSFQLASGGKTFYVGNYLGKNYLDVDVNFEGIASNAQCFRYLGNRADLSIYKGAFMVWMSQVGDVYFVNFGYQDMDTNLNTVVPTKELTASDYGIADASSDFNVKILTDVTSAEDEDKEVITYQFWLNDKFVCEGSFEETAHERMGLCAQVPAGKTLTVKVPGAKVDPFAGYERITLSDYNATMTAGTLTAPLANGAQLTHQGDAGFNKTYIDVDVNYNGNVGWNTNMLRFYASDRYKDSYNLAWETTNQLVVWRYDYNQKNTTLGSIKNVSQYGINSPSDWFNVKIKIDAKDNGANKTVNLQIWLNDQLAATYTVDEVTPAANRNKIFVSTGSSISARVPMDVEEELKGYTPVTLNDYDGAKTYENGNMITTVANNTSISAPLVDFNTKTYLDVDVNFNGMNATQRGHSNFRYQASGKWTDSYVLGWINATTLDFFNYRNGSTVVALAENIVAADYGISGPDAWFNVKIATDITVDSTDATKQTVKLQLWLNDRLAYIGEFEETRTGTSRAAIWVTGSYAPQNITFRSPVPTLEEALKDHTPITLDDYACDMNIRGEVAVANAKSITANVSKFDKTYLDVDVNFGGVAATGRGQANFRYQASAQWTDSYVLGWKSATTLDFFNYRNGSTVVDLNANIVAADYGISGPNDWFNVKIVTDIIGEGATSQTVKLQLWLNDKLAYSGIHTESRNGTSRAAIWVTGSLAPQKVTFRSARNVEEQLEGYTRVTLEEMEGIGASRAEEGTTYNFGRAGQYLGGSLDKTYLDMDVKSSGGLFMTYLMSEKTVWGNDRYQMELSGTNLKITPVFAGTAQTAVTLGLGSVGYTEGEMFNLKIRNDIDGNTVILQFWYNNKYVAKLTFTEPAARTPDCLAVYGNATTTTVVRTPMIGVTREEVAYDLSNGAYLLTGADYFYVNGKKMPAGTVLAAPNDYLVERVVDGQVADSKMIALYYLGDVNLDGSAFESGDPVWKDGHALSGIVNYGTPMKSAMKAADINNDGKVTQADFDAFVIIRGDVTKKDEVLSQYHTDAVSYEYLGGKDVMPIGGFYGPYDLDTVTDGMFQLIKESGVNLITYTPANAETGESDLQRALVLAEKYGIGVFVSDDGLNVIQKDANGNVTGQTTVTSAEDLAEHMAAYSNYDSFLGINVVDEPKGANDWSKETNKDDADTYYKRYNYYRDLAKAILPYTNITSYINMHGSQAMDKGTYATYVNEIANDVDVLSFDTYLYFEQSAYTQLTRLSAYLESLDTVRQASLDSGKPFWSYVQAGTDYRDDSSDAATKGYYTEADTLWIVNTSLAFGAKGISYFPLLQPKHFSLAPNGSHDYDRNGIIGANNETTRYYAMVQKANKQIAAIDDVLMNAMNKGVIVTGTAKSNINTAALGRNHTFTGILSQVNNGQYTDMLRNVTTSANAGAMVGVFDYQGYDAYYVVNYSRTASQNITLNLNTEAKYRVIADAVTTTGNASDITLNIPAGAGVLVVMEEQYVGGNNVAKVGDVKYASLAEAFDAAGNGGTVTLIDNVALTETIELGAANVTLNLGDYTISGGTIATLGAGAMLTIDSDGGKLEGKLKLAGSGATINADCDIALDANGKDATVNAQDVVLTDSATDNGVLGGKISGSFTVANRVTENNGIRYVVLDHGTYKTANAVRVKVTKVSIRPKDAGIYYTTEVKFNKNIADVGASYGVALSITAKPENDFMNEVDGQYTSLWTVMQAAKGANFSNSGTSALVNNIFFEEAGDANAELGETEIFANGYVMLTVGEEKIVIMAENTTDVVYSMRTIMEAMDGSVLDNGVLTETGKKVLAFYKQWQSAMASWELPNLVEAAKDVA